MKKAEAPPPRRRGNAWAADVVDELLEAPINQWFDITEDVPKDKTSSNINAQLAKAYSRHVIDIRTQEIDGVRHAWVKRLR